MEVTCPTCKKKIEWNASNPHRPFCSKRCQLIDLGEWSNEQMTIPGSPPKPDEKIDMPDIEEIEAMLAAQQQNFFKD